MREHPILFSAPMVRAILDGRKTQTRRILKPQPVPNEHAPGKHWVAVHCVRSMVDVEDELQGVDTSMAHCLNPYGKPGDKLWVRETWRCYGGREYEYQKQPENIIFRATDEGGDGSDGWRPSIFMPRWASRITLEISDVRVQRLQEISGKDILAEGAVTGPHTDQFGRNPVSAFDGKVYLDLISLWAKGWDSINAKRAPWDSNPFVWAITFKVADAQQA